MTEVRYPVEPLTRFTSDLLAAAGMEGGKAQTVARLLVLTDMLGRHTHGVALCPLYLDQLEKGLMTPHGEPECPALWCCSQRPPISPNGSFPVLSPHL
ncbi:Ldh family oxidoreductase (plasmid) [Skermanella rosea]|uniref:Ldh family oxidoreductase n=1 Tax=Skermanella rosea TaxID=1817965 RepID=UPI0019343CD5|nr:Ldh family oxidoreductase [Skermanella rosea]UEM07175.1 Ldh family oxidoreductase [Skermanella rosea]